MEKARQKVDEFAASLNIDPTNLNTLTRAIEELRDKQAEAAAAAAGTDPWGPMYREAAAEAKAYSDQIGELEGDYRTSMWNMMSVSAQTGESFASIRAKAAEMGVDLTASGLAGQDAAKEIVDGFAEADAAARNQQIGSAFQEMADDTEEATRRLQEWSSAVDAAMGADLGLEAARLRHASALEAATEALKANGNTLDINTEAGRDNRQKLLDLAQAGADLAAAEGEVAGSTQHATNVMQIHRGQMESVMRQFGFTEREARSYLATLGLAPDDISTLVHLEKEQAHRDIINTLNLFGRFPGTKTVRAVARVHEAWRDMNNLTAPKTVNVTARVSAAVGAVTDAARRLFGFASGGYIDPRRFGGIPGRDSIPAMLMPGEYVVRKSAVDQLGVQFLDKLNKGVHGYAAGGPVRATASPMRITVPQRAPAQVQRTGPAVHIDRVEVAEEVDVDVFAKRLGFLAAAGSL